MTRVQRYRSAAALKQNNLCYYCQWPMWNGEVDSLPTYKRVYGLTRPQAQRLLCTAGHLEPRGDGGPDTVANIVAACDACNKRRARSHAGLSADGYKALVKKRVAKGAWHSASYRKVVGRTSEPATAPTKHRQERTPGPPTNGQAHATM